MGAAFGRQWAYMGYYPDLVVGYVSTAGGFPIMIRYPEELLKIPPRCTCCGKSSWLKTYDMYSRLTKHRIKFSEYVNYIVAKRVACGDPNPNPYYGFATPKGKKKAKNTRESLDLWTADSLDFLWKNEVAPVKPGPDDETIKSKFGIEAPTYTPIDPDVIIICGFCGKGMSHDRRLQIWSKREKKIRKAILQYQEKEKEKAWAKTGLAVK